jgi:hypothetical protein
MSQSLVVDQSRDLPAGSVASGASNPTYLGVQCRNAGLADFESSRAAFDQSIESVSIGPGMFEWSVR